MTLLWIGEGAVFAAALCVSGLTIGASLASLYHWARRS